MKFFGRFNNLPIERKLLLVSCIPILALGLLSVVTFNSVQTFSQDEDRLNKVYHVQTTAAEYMRLIVDLETGFRGFVLTLQPKFLKPYNAAKQRVLQVGQTLAQMVKPDLDQHQEILKVQSLVLALMEDKDRLIERAKNGHPKEAVQYIETGTGRQVMLAIREEMANFDRREVEILRDTLERTSNDRAYLLSVIIGGGSLALIPMVLVLRLLAQSIAGPLVTLAKTVENRSGGTIPEVQVLDRGDEIGDLTRAMHEMSQQIREYIAQVQKSEAELRSLNIDLSTSESKYRGIVDHAPFGIFTAKQGKIIFSNRHNWVLAGRQPDDTPDPEEIWDAIHPEDREQVFQKFSEASANHVPFESVYRFLHPNGTIHRILSRAIPIQDSEGHELLYQGFNVDITALENMREKLNRSEKLATLGQVAAGIAHEIRNPLVGIGSTTSLLMDDFSPKDPQYEDLSTILKETRRLDRIVNQIVEYARPRELNPTAFDMPALVKETMELIDTSIAQKQIHTTFAFGAELHDLEADRDQIKQILLNAFQNAIDALPLDGTLHVEVKENTRGGMKGTVTNIQDNGKGIPPEDLIKIFDPFFTSGKERGTGLGLAICRNIIEAHGGQIRATSELGVGTVLSIWLPLTIQPQTPMVS
ncbi:ATP-binding protein [Candidatus Nitronereus thalassa]|uniref:histidine kinase n=1 Tax=Candidatus Nitronereus thalassa TaxID=3020898 RepID=A0ABU3K7H9_9BACT|nr:ATP-binding protein [Candidatus Nitronereus thalassa]MDT7042349.1 ATP-binding protein [Candidatus Nitronereus thalassa]